MKKQLILVVFLIFVILDIKAQKNKDNIIREFLPVANISDIILQVGESKSIEIDVVRAKNFQNDYSTLEFRSLLPDGLKIIINPQINVKDKAIITFEALKTIKKGSYSLFLNCQMRYINRGIMLTVKVE